MKNLIKHKTIMRMVLAQIWRWLCTVAGRNILQIRISCLINILTLVSKIWVIVTVIFLFLITISIDKHLLTLFTSTFFNNSLSSCQLQISFSYACRWINQFLALISTQGLTFNTGTISMMLAGLNNLRIYALTRSLSVIAIETCKTWLNDVGLLPMSRNIRIRIIVVISSINEFIISPLMIELWAWNSRKCWSTRILLHILSSITLHNCCFGLFLSLLSVLWHLRFIFRYLSSIDFGGSFMNVYMINWRRRTWT